MDKSPVKESKRERIMNAAVQVFARTGYHDTKIEDVAAAAGIGKGTVYEYFDSKLHLFQEIMNKSVSMYYNNIGAENQKTMSFEERIRHLLESHFAFCLQQKDLARILLLDTEYMDKELRDWEIQKRQEREDRLQEIIEEAAARGEIRPVDSRLFAMSIVGITGAVFLPVILGYVEIEPREAAAVYTDIIMNGVGITRPA